MAVRGIVSPLAVNLQDRQRLGRVHVIVELQEQEPPRPLDELTKAGSNWLSNLLGDQPTASRSLRATEGIELAHRFSEIPEVAGFQVVSLEANSSSCTAWDAVAKPTAILRIWPGEIRAEVSRKTSSENSSFAASLMIKYRLESWPEGAAIATGQVLAQSRGAASGRLSEWLEDVGDIPRIAAEALGNVLLPREEYRIRELPKTGVKKPSRQEKYWGLGVKQEQAGDWQAAHASYAEAVAANRGSSDAVTIAQYERELTERLSLLSLTAVPSPEYISDALVAVLPFANESNNVSAAMMARDMTRDLLNRRGVHLVAVDQMEAAVHGLGISDGGQLQAISASVLAESFPGAWTVAGTVKEFRTVSVGVFSRKAVDVQFEIRDASGRTVCTTRGFGIRQGSESVLRAGKALIGQLGTSAIQKATGTYLVEELEEALTRALGLFPALVRYRPTGSAPGAQAWRTEARQFYGANFGSAGYLGQRRTLGAAKLASAVPGGRILQHGFSGFLSGGWWEHRKDLSETQLIRLHSNSLTSAGKQLFGIQPPESGTGGVSGLGVGVFKGWGIGPDAWRSAGYLPYLGAGLSFGYEHFKAEQRGEKRVSSYSGGLGFNVGGGMDKIIDLPGRDFLLRLAVRYQVAATGRLDGNDLTWMLGTAFLGRRE